MGAYGMASVSLTSWPGGRPTARASWRRALAASFSAATSRRRSVCCCTCVRNTSIPAAMPALLRSVVSPYNASAVSSAACAVSTRAAVDTAFRYRFATTSTTSSRAFFTSCFAAVTRARPARAPCSALTSSNGCETVTRVSNTLNGPTVGSVSPGNSVNPNSARLTTRRASPTRAETFGSRPLRASQREPRADSRPCSCRSTPRLCASPRSIASRRPRGTGVDVASP